MDLLDFKEWFESRGLRPFEYQHKLLQGLNEAYKEHEEVVLAACTGAGKTKMSIYFVEKYLKENKHSRVLILAHGTVVLRSQFHLSIAESRPSFTYKAIESRGELEESREQVVVTLPQTVSGQDLSGFDLLIVDEAHHFYFGKTVQDMINQGRFKKQLLLTGTPSSFVLRDYKILCIAENEVIDYGQISDLSIEIASSSYDFSMDDFNKSQNIKDGIKIDDAHTQFTMDELLKQIVKRLKSIHKNDPEAYYQLQGTVNWSLSFKSIGKTMIACQNQDQARSVANYMRKNGVSYALSTSHTDSESTEIDRFQDDPDCKLLIVVNRGVLGFNMPELETVIDMTLTQNIDRIKQLMGRVLRVHPNENKKLFVKIAPISLKEYYKYIMTCVMCLTDKEYLTTYNGKNFNSMRIPVKRITNPNPTENKKKTTSTNEFQPIDFEGMPSIELFKQLSNKEESVLNGYGYVELIDAVAQIGVLSKLPNDYWTYERCANESLKYTKKSDFQKWSAGAYNASFRNGWLDEICAHMETSRNGGYWTYERCAKEALKYNTRERFRKGSSGAYDKSRIKGWLDEICAHMETSRNGGYWTYERCAKEALKYNKRTDFCKGSGGAYNSAIKNNWLDEICAHMKTSRNGGYWTYERCAKEALKYNKRTDFCKGSGGAYDRSRIKGWLDEICAHMESAKTRKKK
ncbi:DEAD/DEAH box helicase [Roseivirga spongicola]|uniref:DEAD/DEAH box helicase n=1 Tax=Roseivirga spongicola TaxID=333140 RepID=UPI002AC967B5|nr:DEAD/DEAH box helicase family protein [Roseivirga spongicola]WPZ08794.1 DEAD/DEAH box helicase family protein [Roseivirga spongicola]